MRRAIASGRSAPKQPVIRIVRWVSSLALLVLAGCAANDADIGTVMVSVATQGGTPDPDGYVLTIGDQSGRAVGVNDEITVADLPPGNYSATLSGLAGNCFVTGANPVTLHVAAGQQASADFAVSCPVIGARVKVTTVSSGNDTDLDGYYVTFGTGAAKHVVTSGVTMLSSDDAGPVAVVVSGVAPNCTPDPANPTTITVVANTEVPLPLNFACTAISGAIKVAVVTSGADVQQHGFAVTVDGRPITLGLDNTGMAGRLEPSAHSVSLSEGSLHDNCNIIGSRSQTVTVEIGDTSMVTFTVGCTARPHVIITVSTAGPGVPGTGMSVVLLQDDFFGGYFALDTLPIPASGTVVASDLTWGRYLLQVIAPANCHVTTLTPNDFELGLVDVHVTLALECAQERPMAFVSGVGASSEIAIGNEASGTMTKLTSNMVADSNPAWSSDGARLAFTSTRDGNDEIYRMNADGSGVVRLTNGASADYQPTWSPDGTRIAFVSRRDGSPAIYVMGADGSNPVRLTNSQGADADPAWSPDGQRIVFVRTPPQSFGAVHVMNADGTGVTRLTTSAFAQSAPTWSASGAQIAFTQISSLSVYLVYVMDADGSHLTARHAGAVRPGLSWDAADRIAFLAATPCRFGSCGVGLGVLRPDASWVAMPWLVAAEPAWRP